MSWSFLCKVSRDAERAYKSSLDVPPLSKSTTGYLGTDANLKCLLHL